MAATNVMVFIHGMIPDLQPSEPFGLYQQFWNDLLKAEPELGTLFTPLVQVQWGHEPPGLAGPPPQPDRRLTRAQQEVVGRVALKAVAQHPGSNNVILPVFGDFGLPFVRKLVIRLREELLLPGVGDVIYYCSKEGETHVRSAIYGQALAGLDAYKNENDVRLHFFSHSLGVTVTHDFLYGLFNPDPSYTSGYVTENQADEDGTLRYHVWRKKFHDGELSLGSFSSAASQLPLFVMRKQSLVDRLAIDKKGLDPANIGIKPGGPTRWQLFYDVDDPLGFATRPLYEPNDTVREMEVNTHIHPDKAHTEYWTNQTVIRETAALLKGRAKD